MNNRKISNSNKKYIKIEIKTLAEQRYKGRQIVVIDENKIRKANVAVVKYKPEVRKIGKNYIELTPISQVEPIAFEVSPLLKPHNVSPKVQIIARLMKRAPIAGIRRLGIDLIDD